MERRREEKRLSDDLKRVAAVLTDPRELIGTVREYLGIGRNKRRQEPVTNREQLRHFLQTRSSFVAQTTLYGYLRTRAGMRYPELFDDDGFVQSINIAKWQLWLSCLSDLSVYAGSLMVTRAADARAVPELLHEAVTRILDETGIPADSGPHFAASAQEVLDRLGTCDLTIITDDEAAFSESPAALVRWAPIVDELKELDEPIVLNSVRFRWQEVRRDLRQSLDTGGVLAG